MERDKSAILEEAAGLAIAINLKVINAISAEVRVIKPATLFGSGKLEEIHAIVSDNEIGLVIVDSALSPIQQRNLEKAWKCKVIDRTALILEIFGDRAVTREGKLQVEMAALNYQRTRLVRSWTHLERQRGGFGFLGGPGETQLEIDKRLIKERIRKIAQELEKVAKTRNLHRSNRKRSNLKTVALVGYTNAGKSTLFNRLTGEKVVAKDMLFATLDPTLRKFRLGNEKSAILSDTVGFISNLPTELVAAFKATLEEVIEADIIIHVRDISHPDTEIQKVDVIKVLSELGVDDKKPIIEVCNKSDLLDSLTDNQQKNDLIEGKSPNLFISAAKGTGIEELLKEIQCQIDNIEAQEDYISLSENV